MSTLEESQLGEIEDHSTLQLQPETTGSQTDNTQLQVGFGPLQTPRALQPPPPQSCLDLKGDLCIEVGTVPTKSFIVCSRTLARTSPFWEKMLYGEFKESKRLCPQSDNLEWVVKLPEDNPTAMRLLLSIAHGRFNVVPGYEDPICVRDLYEVSVITDKYDMTHILQPWARGWLQSTLCSTESTGGSLREQYYHEQLWISWEFGDKANFEEIANILLLNSCVPINTTNSLRCAGILEPPEIYNVIEQTRLETIKAILAPFHDTIHGLIRNNDKFCSKRKKESHAARCLPLMLGTGIQSLHGLGLWPIPQPTEIQCSVSVLLQKLKDVKFESDKCSQGPALQVEIETVLNSIPSLLTEGHELHLNSQAKKSRVSML